MTMKNKTHSKLAALWCWLSRLVLRVTDRAGYWGLRARELPDDKDRAFVVPSLSNGAKCFEVCRVSTRNLARFHGKQPQSLKRAVKYAERLNLNSLNTDLNHE